MCVQSGQEVWVGRGMRGVSVVVVKQVMACVHANKAGQDNRPSNCRRMTGQDMASQANK